MMTINQTVILYILLLVLLIGLIWLTGLALSNFYANLSLKQGQIYFQQRDYSAAIAQYTSALRLNNQLAAAYIGRAAIFAQVGFSDKAIADANQALKLNVKEPAIYFILGRAYLNQGRGQGQVRAALTDLDRALNLEPKYPGVHYYRGVAHLWLGNKSAALADFQSEIDLVIEPPIPSIFNPEDIYLHRGSSYFHLDQPERAIAELDTACTFSVDLDQVYIVRAFARTYIGDLQGALEDFTRVLQHTPQWDAEDHRYNRGVIHYLLGNFTQAVSDFTQVLKIDPAMTTAYYWRGHAYFELNHKPGATKDYQKSQEYPDVIESQDQHGYYARGLVRWRLNQVDDAIADLQQALSLASKHRDAGFQDLVAATLQEIQPPEHLDSEVQESSPSQD